MEADRLWLDVEGGYALALVAGEVVCRNKRGKLLASIPAKVKKGQVARELLELRDWLGEHSRECRGQVEEWMLRSLPVPRAVLEALWVDPRWRDALESALVVACDEAGELDLSRAGLLQALESGRGVGVVTLGGHSEWLEVSEVAIPHPILLGNLDDYRGLTVERGLRQGIAQLFRETHSAPAELDPQARHDRRFAGGEFSQARLLIERCRALGYTVSGGYARCPVWESGVRTEARYWVGMGPTWGRALTSELLWVDSKHVALPAREVGAVAYSEGVRMASAIYAGRRVEEEGG
jgi:hypothetical protein